MSKDERFLHEIAAAIQEESQSAEILFVPGEQHATNILERRPDLAERLAVWFARALTR